MGRQPRVDEPVFNRITEVREAAGTSLIVGALIDIIWDIPDYTDSPEPVFPRGAYTGCLAIGHEEHFGEIYDTQEQANTLVSEAH